jgi:heme-degrading monooxygenase HmoA
MPITILRNRLDADMQDEYMEIATKLNEMAPTMPGYVSHKRFVADDGERVTIVEFEDEETQKAWANEPLHRRAMALGKAKFFSEYDIAICTVTRRYSTKLDTSN